MTAPSTALSHLKVLDLTRVRAGPTCCRVLADFGADVIKIEAPQGVDPNAGVNGARHGFDMLNLHRNKRSLTLNLKKPEGRAVLMKMVETADVVVENFRPDVKDRLGIGYEDLKAVNPRIILASISGFGQDGPYAKRAGFDQIAQGMGGLMGVTGEPSGAPTRAGAAVADSTSGIYAATGILVALAERERSGEGQWVSTSLLEAQIALMDFQAARYLVEDQVPHRAGNDHPDVVPMGVVETADGYLNLGVGGQGQWVAFCKVIEEPDLAEQAEYATLEDRRAHRDALWAHLRPIFKTKPTTEWVTELEAGGVPAGPIYEMDQVFADPQVEHLGMAAPVHDPVRGDTRLVSQPIKMSRTPASVYKSAPDAGEHSDEILAEYGLSPTEVAELRAANII
ncbi:MAG: CaiB/BaiF CoA-transferase family protein [Dinoroseobacter sp.]|nr:CaiB/BaiF CoA-transferase family protein [Dinoroseobacter sp.]